MTSDENQDTQGLRGAAAALSRISHELKTPLVTIKGYAELLLDQTQEPLSPRLRDWVRRIAAAANRLDATFRKVTGESRTDAGWSYHAASIAPGSWIQRCVEEARDLASSRQLEWTQAIAEATPNVSLDPDAGRDLLLELLQNAARATPNGGRITVGAASELRDGRRGARITVSDTGVGVPTGAAGDSLFERFVVGGSLDAHHSGDFDHGAEGLGVGLAMVRGVARAHGGEAWAEGRGRDPATLPGAAFCVWLPAAEEDRPTMDAATPPPQRGRLLVVDSDLDASRILTEALSGAYDVESATSSAEALSAWRDRSASWHACIFDPKSCPEGGVAFTRALRLAPGSSETAIIVYTDAASSLGSEALRAAGADACMSKPVRARVILQRLQSVRSRKARDLPPPDTQSPSRE